MENENPRYACDICGAEFATPSKLGGHKQAHQTKISREKVQAELRRLAKVSGRTPTVEMMREKGAYSPGCVKSRFDSWSEALRSIGHTPNFRNDISDTDLITDINTIAETLGRPPTAGEHRDRGEYAVKHMQNTFGSWNEALTAAGYEPHCEKSISRARLIQQIHTVVEQLGRVPTDAEIDEHSSFQDSVITDAGTVGKPLFAMQVTSPWGVHQELVTVIGKRILRTSGEIIERTGVLNE